MRLKRAVIGLCLGFLPVASAGAAEGVVLGDSIGEGVAMASGLKGLAKIGVHIRGPKALKQIDAAPEGSTAFVVLGTNDAEGSIDRLDKHIGNILDAAKKRKLKIVWLGPPCVRKSWDARARNLDSLLAKTLAARSIRYVSMRDEKLCDGSFSARDGVHMKMKGYAYMWVKARTAAGFPATEAEKKAETAASTSLDKNGKTHAHKKPARKKLAETKKAAG